MVHCFLFTHTCLRVFLFFSTLIMIGGYFINDNFETYIFCNLLFYSREVYMKIGIVGTGSVGMLFAVKLQNARHNVELVYLDDNNAVYDKKYIFNVKNLDCSVESTCIKTLSDLSQMGNNKDVIFVLTRAKLSEKVVSIVESNIQPKGKIVVLNNWYNIFDVVTKKNIDKLIGLYFDFNVIKEQDTACITKSGSIYIGQYNAFRHQFADNDEINVHAIASMLSSICDTYVETRFMELVAGRLILNITLNTMLAITGVNVGKLLSIRRGRYVFTKMIEESVNVFNAIGISPRPYVGKLNYRLFVSDTYNGKVYRRRIIRLLRDNNKYYTSRMSWLICMGKDTDVEYGVKKVAVFGKKYNVNVKYTYAVSNIVSDIAKHKKHISIRILFDKSLI